MDSLGEKIEKILEAKGMSQRQFALKAGVAPSNLNHYIKGRKNPGKKVMEKLCNTLNVSKSYLL